MADTKASAPTIAGRQEYELTSKAGSRVAGRVTAGKRTLLLSPEEAEYELREGTIRLRQAPAASDPAAEPGATEAPKPADAAVQLAPSSPQASPQPADKGLSKG